MIRYCSCILLFCQLIGNEKAKILQNTVSVMNGLYLSIWIFFLFLPNLNHSRITPFGELIPIVQLWMFLSKLVCHWIVITPIRVTYVQPRCFFHLERNKVENTFNIRQQKKKLCTCLAHVIFVTCFPFLDFGHFSWMILFTFSISVLPLLPCKMSK